MKYLIAVLLSFLSICGFSEKGGARVFAKGIKEPYQVAVEIDEPTSSSLIYALPIESSEGVIISQGPLNIDGSHGYLNCLYALDFSSGYYSEVPAGNILAARDGVVIGINDEGSSGALFNTDLKGNGFGNWIAIQHECDEVSLYAHLDAIIVHIGEKVQQGQIIGKEGATGAAGWRHLHFSVHRLQGKTSENTPPYYPDQYECIPYRLTYLDQVIRTVDVRNFVQMNLLSPEVHRTKLFPAPKLEQIDKK